MNQRTLLGRLLSPAGFGLVLIFFLLPFTTVSCGSATEKAEATFDNGFTAVFDSSRVADARVAVGGVATKPWRLESVEAALRGAPATEAAFEAAASVAADGARPLSGNGFKVSLLKRTVVRALIEGSR